MPKTPSARLPARVALHRRQKLAERPPERRSTSVCTPPSYRREAEFDREVETCRPSRGGFQSTLGDQGRRQCGNPRPPPREEQPDLYTRPVSDSPPKVFISSTVRDLADLRSAIKFWLEDYGFEVLTSESADFPHPLDRDAIAAALAPIADCDYYLLLVGARVGALTEDEGISVTRAEFRHARKLLRESGKPQMLHLVRLEIHTARVSDGPPRGVRGEDWSTIRSFLTEIATEEIRGDPNWVHPFSTFRDVVDVLRATLRVSGPLRRKALEANLKWEIVENTRELLFRTEKGIGVKVDWLPKDKVPLVPIKQVDTHVGYPAVYWLFMFRLGLPRMATLTRSALDEAIDSGLFLDYDPRAAVLVVGTLQRSLLELRRHMSRLSGIVDSINGDEGVRRDIAQCIEASKQERGATVADLTVVYLHAARDAMDNVLRLNRALYCHLDGLEPEFQRPSLLPASPYGEQAADKREDPNRRETITWLRLAAWPDRANKRSPGEAGTYLDR